MIHFEKLGIYLSKPVAFLLAIIYLMQTALVVYLLSQRFDLEKQVNFQQKRIAELEEKLQLYKAVEDLEIGFSDDEKGMLTNVIYSEAKKYHYNPLFLVSIILTESTFKKHEVSPKGATGLMQLAPITGADVAPKAGVKWEGTPTLFEPESNIKLGSYLLFSQILKYRDVKKALAAYNMGDAGLRGYVREHRTLPKQYYQKVMDTYKRLKETYQS